jgi:hypothetical protein
VYHLQNREVQTGSHLLSTLGHPIKGLQTQVNLSVKEQHSRESKNSFAECNAAVVANGDEARGDAEGIRCLFL